jgi:hypothetical protein
VADGKVIYNPTEVTYEPPAEGANNADLVASRDRVIRVATYRDCSTVALVPVPKDSGSLHWKMAAALQGMIRPMNQPFHLQYIEGFEVADAYNEGIRMVLANPQLQKFSFVLTIEHDNPMPPDGLMKLIETLYSGPWAGVGGLYWTKGEGGAPMIYGDPKDPVPNFRPQPPVVEGVQECRGIAMGFTLWDLDLFRDKRLPMSCEDPEDLSKGAQWFRTMNHWSPQTGVQAGTQDLDFCARAGVLGYRFAIDTRVRVGHIQLQKSPTHPAGFVW